MANVKTFLRLLPCLLLTACGSPTPDGQLPVPSGEAAPTRAAPAASIGKTDDHAGSPAAPSPAATTAARPSIPVDASSLPSVANVPGISCTKQREGWAPECVAGEYEIAVYTDGCSGDGFYGEVHSDESLVTLRTGFAEFPAKPVAKLRQNQFVCVSADVRKHVGERLWYYVMAIPAETVKACKGKDLCGDPGQPNVEWVQPSPQGTCRLEHGQYVDCAAGWVSADEFAEYSNGL